MHMHMCMWRGQTSAPPLVHRLPSMSEVEKMRPFCQSSSANPESGNEAAGSLLEAAYAWPGSTSRLNGDPGSGAV